jgi:thymidylate synthase ThyX
MKPTATIITDNPIIEIIADMQLDHAGVMNMAKWVQQYRPQCVPESGFQDILDLVPHDGYDLVPDVGHQHNDKDCYSHSTNEPSQFTCTRPETPFQNRKVTDNELLCEFAGRKCYDSFADAGAKRNNGAYLRSMWEGRVPHRSTGYHAKMSFFFAHISRRVSHELIRNYVGADRDEEGSPSQESTRFTHHPGTYIAHPYYLESEEELARFKEMAQLNYETYVATIQRKVQHYASWHNGVEPKGLDKKRIYESTAGDLLMSCGTSFIWTTNPQALTKFFFERDDESADMEMCRFARSLKKVCFDRWPNLFPHFVKTPT